MKKLLTIIIIVIIAIILFVFLRQSEETVIPEIPATQTNQETTIDDTKNSNIVTYTNDGFIPKEIEILEGETIEFINQSDGEMWVASAQHPTHTVYPKKSDDDCLGSSFDACKSMANGVLWSFTFNEVGEWEYHNHVQSSDWGRVIVK